MKKGTINPSEFIPIEWVRVDKFLAITGDTRDAIDDRIASSAWAEGVHYKRTGPRTLWINVKEFNRWITRLPVVQAQQPPSRRV